MLSPMNDMDFLGAVFDIPNRPAEKPLAMAFIQKQMSPNVMDTDKGFCTGTIFNELDKPFKPWGDK